MQQQADNLPQFIRSDPRGMNLVQALAQLEQIRQEETEQMQTELRELAKGVDHMRNIIDMQQSTARQTQTLEPFAVNEVIHDALELYTNVLNRLGITLSLHLTENLQAQTDRPSVIHILVNLISNARNAIAESSQEGPREITIQTSLHEQWVVIEVSDTGPGIDPGNLPHLFEYGFTTRDTGHGFGLHHSINTARELSGTLSVHSDGLGKGATFTLRIPAATVEYPVTAHAPSPTC
jgi:signal transduction histidine kinase